MTIFNKGGGGRSVKYPDMERVMDQILTTPMGWTKVSLDNWPLDQ